MVGVHCINLELRWFFNYSPPPFSIFYYQSECLLVVVDVRLKKVFGDEVVLHAVALLVPLGPTCV